jgi:tRNA pseudouridine38-40 synthase
MRNILLDLEYDGTDFLGSQVQAVGRTVQGELERALQQLTQQETRVTLAGRTDAGVHARGQRANFRTQSQLPLETFVRGLNALLPPDLAVQRAQEVAESFHARFDAGLRVYRYTLYNSPIRSPLARRVAWQVPGALDLAAMAAGLALLVGKHDFSSYAGAAEGPARVSRVTVRTIHAARCWAEMPWIYVEIAADSFLRTMVRNIVGELVRLGQGITDLAGFRAIWEARDRKRAGAPAPPQGLCLVRVEYDGGL